MLVAVPASNEVAILQQLNKQQDLVTLPCHADQPTPSTHSSEAPTRRHILPTAPSPRAAITSTSLRCSSGVAAMMPRSRPSR